MFENGHLKAPNTQKNLKKSYSKQPHDQDLKKTASRRGQTSKIDDSYTVLTVFSEIQDSRNGLKMGAKMEPPGTRNHKKSKNNALEKTSKNNTAKS